MIELSNFKAEIKKNVADALQEDIRTGDITAALIPTNETCTATVITREHAILCGTAWAAEAFYQVDSSLNLEWHFSDGDALDPNDQLLTVSGSARAILTAERTVLNFLQTLSGTATRCNHYAGLTKDLKVKLLDTRKTIPGLRLAQKYAVSCGGCFNHRMGLYDAFLIKENHIKACGSISNAISTAKKNHPDKPIEVEVESLAQLQEAIAAECDTVMLDNFSLEEMRLAVKLAKNIIKLEASGGIDDTSLLEIAHTGVDYISMGTLTKSLEAIDLSLRIQGRLIKDF